MQVVRQITSIKDDLVLQARELSTAAGRRKWRKCLLEGEEIIRWAMQAGMRVEHVFYNAKVTEHNLLTSLSKQEIMCYAVSEGILKKISDTSYVIPFLGVAELIQRDEQGGEFGILLDGVRDYGNIGTIIRTAKAFGINEIFSTSPELDLFYRKTIEASRGTVFSVRLKHFTSAADAVSKLKNAGFQIVATSPHGKSIQASTKLQNKPLVLVVGNESEGVCDTVLQNADLVVQIPMSSQVESLNVGVATGISLYEFKLKWVIEMLRENIRRTLGREVNVTGKLIQGAFDVRLKAVSAFDSTQVIFMMVLKCDEKMTREQISKDTALFGAELDAMLDPLLKEQLIWVDGQGEYCLTEKGEILLGQLWGVLEASENEIFDGFSEQEQGRFLSDLQRLQRNCVHLIKGYGGSYEN